jgi:hypothetical protein
MSLPTHRCGAVGCSMVTATRFAMCYRHWIMVPRELQEAIDRHYINMHVGRERRRYLIALCKAQLIVAKLEEHDTEPLRQRLDEMEAQLKESINEARK